MRARRRSRACIGLIIGSSRSAARATIAACWLYGYIQLTYLQVLSSETRECARASVTLDIRYASVEQRIEMNRC